MTIARPTHVRARAVRPTLLLQQTGRSRDPGTVARVSQEVGGLAGLAAIQQPGKGSKASSRKDQDGVVVRGRPPNPSTGDGQQSRSPAGRGGRG
jgi:hypothetical protein